MGYSNPAENSKDLQKNIPDLFILSKALWKATKLINEGFNYFKFYASKEQ